MDQYPALANIEYHVANVSAGDCLLIPSQWAFQERSLEATITIVYSLSHQQMLMIDSDETERCLNSTQYDENFTVDQIDWTAERQPPSLK